MVIQDDWQQQHLKMVVADTGMINENLTLSSAATGFLLISLVLKTCFGQHKRAHAAAIVSALLMVSNVINDSSYASTTTTGAFSGFGTTDYRPWAFYPAAALTIGVIGYLLKAFNNNYDEVDGSLIKKPSKMRCLKIEIIEGASKNTGLRNRKSNPS